ncbi:hypothetical protein FPV67DRAFT_1454403 [Lyophyllum atratum]|nr:hypothetical protein FPV67DRAFT_1454403 [Lyophyllum atratum]
MSTARPFSNNVTPRRVVVISDDEEDPPNEAPPTYTEALAAGAPRREPAHRRREPALRRREPVLRRREPVTAIAPVTPVVPPRLLTLEDLPIESARNHRGKIVRYILGRPVPPYELTRPSQNVIVNNYYVITVGQAVGIFYDWCTVGSHTNGVPCAAQEGFDSWETAHKVYTRLYNNKHVKVKILLNGPFSKPSNIAAAIAAAQAQAHTQNGAQSNGNDVLAAREEADLATALALSLRVQ